MAVKSYSDLIAWQKALDLVEAAYRMTRGFQREETFGLTSQMRRASISIPSNLAEGQGRSSTKDFLHFISIAQGSLNELETQIILGRRLGYLDEASKCVFLEQSAEVGRLMNGLASALSRRSTP